MVVVGHQTVRVTDPREALDNLTQKLKEGDSIRICEEDSAAIVAATGDVVRAPSNSILSGRAMGSA